MTSDFTFHQLRSFVAVAEDLSFRRAAERLHVSQPPLSRQIRSLEHSLGVELLDRGRRNVSLTAAGEVFLLEARALVESAGRARRLARDVHDGRVGSIRVGYTEPAAFDLLPHVLARFRQSLPEVDLELSEMHSFEAVRQLERRAVDVAYLRPPVESDKIELTMLHPDRLIAVLPENHPHEASPLQLRDLEQEPFVAYSARLGSGITSSTLQACAAAGFSPQIVRHATSTPMLMSLVANGAGVAIVSHQFASIPYIGVKFAQLTDERAESYVAFASRVDEPMGAVDTLRTISRNVSETVLR